MDVLLEASIIGRRADHRTIPNHVNTAAVSWAPIQNHEPVAIGPTDCGAESDASTAARVSTDQPVAEQPVDFDRSYREIVVIQVIDIAVRAARDVTAVEDRV